MGLKAVHFGAGNIGRGFVAEFLHKSGYEMVFRDTMGLKTVHVGAGNVGRGFVAESLHKSGYEVVFADIMDSIVDRLPHRRELSKGIEYGEPRVKLGLRGFVNGIETAAKGDTGSAVNVVSLAFAEKMKLEIEPGQQLFRLGNKNHVKSVGQTFLNWAFGDEPNKIRNLVCYVIPNCIYDLILGGDFLKVTETETKFVSRLTRCITSTFRHKQFAYLEHGGQGLDGMLGDGDMVLAVLDTGAECNVISAEFAEENGYNIVPNSSFPRDCIIFADGTSQETEGQVYTSWTFPSGKTVPITFDVLQNCASDVILGEEFIHDHGIFIEHPTEIRDLPSDGDYYELAPFDIARGWQQKLSSKFSGRESKTKEAAESSLELAERKAREDWNRKTDFGTKVDTAANEAEMNRRMYYDRQSLPTGRGQRGPRHVPNIQTAPAPTRHERSRSYVNLREPGAQVNICNRG